MGKTHAFERQRSLRNNDPLAHVYLLQDSYNDPHITHRIKTEFITDMGERLENQPFLQPYAFTVESDEITYDTGLRYMASLKQSYDAARQDVTMGTFNVYHAVRQEAFLLQGEKILAWANDVSNKNHIVAFSLCPPEDELEYSEAKKQSFKPDRMMSSVQLHTKNNGTNETIAFSLDGLTLERLELLLQRLGIDTPVANTTIEQLTVPIVISHEVSARDAVERIINTYDELCQEQSGAVHKQGIPVIHNIVEANAFVAEHSEVYELYKKVITEVAASLGGRVTESLAATIREELAAYYHGMRPEFLSIQSGDYLSEYLASGLIEYLRKQAIPEYLTQKLYKNDQPFTAYGASYDIGIAGASASSAGRYYDGACPSSAITNSLQSVDDQAQQFGIKQVVVYEAPKPIMSKGEFDVLPIGSCPICGAECGTGIKNKKSGRWYCTQANCSAYKEEIYNYVFGIKKQEIAIDDTSSEHNTTRTEKTTHMGSMQNELRDELKQKQNTIWSLKNAIYDENVSDVERARLITELVLVYQEQQSLLRISLGGMR